MVKSMMKKRLALLAVLAVFVCPALAHADLHVDVTQGNAKPLPIAITSFDGDAIGAQISEVITNNLQRSGLFAPINPNSFVEKNIDIARDAAFRRLACDQQPGLGQWPRHE